MVPSLRRRRPVVVAVTPPPAKVPPPCPCPVARCHDELVCAWRTHVSRVVRGSRTQTMSSDGTVRRRIVALAAVATCAAATAAWYLRTQRRLSRRAAASAAVFDGANAAVTTSAAGDEAELEAAFQDAAAWVSQHGGSGLTDAQRLQLYALFKQATAGACAAPPPSRLDFVAHAKWCAELVTNYTTVLCLHCPRVVRVMMQAAVAPAGRAATAQRYGDVPEPRQQACHAGAAAAQHLVQQSCTALVLVLIVVGVRRTESQKSDVLKAFHWVRSFSRVVRLAPSHMSASGCRARRARAQHAGEL